MYKLLSEQVHIELWCSKTLTMLYSFHTMSCMCFCLCVHWMLLMPTVFFLSHRLSIFLPFASKNVLCFMPPLKLERFPIITFTWHLYGSNSLMQQQHFYYASVPAIDSLLQCRWKVLFHTCICIQYIYIIMQCLCYAHENYNFS